MKGIEQLKKKGKPTRLNTQMSSLGYIARAKKKKKKRGRKSARMKT